MTWEELDWAALDRLRALFLKSEPVKEPYWRSESDLASYDFTYAQRIGWKWDAVLEELVRLGWTPPAGPLLDWGCGSGVASRCVVGIFGAGHFGRLRLHDRSGLAMSYARQRASARFPGLDVSMDPQGEEACGTLVVSHVLNELHQDDLPRLLRAVRSAECVLWVEPGTHVVSRGLIELRERLREEFHVVAPCPHRRACGLLPEGRERDWCHFFAKTPTEVFTDGRWARFGQRAGVDLRSLPYSWLVLDRRPVAEWSPHRARVLGFAEVFKPYARVDVCHPGATERIDVAKRTHAAVYKSLKATPPPPEIPLPGVEGGEAADADADGADVPAGS